MLRTLGNMRWAAIGGQTLAVLVAAGPMAMALPTMPLWSGIAALALFNLYAHWRSRRPDPGTSAEGIAHLAVDIGQLGWMVAFSGGIMNPFASLFLLPIAFAAIALPSGLLWLVAGMSLAAYALSILLAVPLPAHTSVRLDLHLWGMVLNLLLSAALLMSFFMRMHEALRQRDRALATLQEKFTRNEGIVALATHAASVAHELNTPLASMTLLLDDLIEDVPDALHEELRSLRALVDTCRDRVHQLAAPADTDAARHIALPRVIEQWQLVRPAIELHQQLDQQLPDVAAAVGHLLLALLNNAADASERLGSRKVELHIAGVDGNLRGEIRDHGPGMDQTRPLLPGNPFHSRSEHGLGIGLALSHATVERLGGNLTMAPAQGVGTRVSFSLPLAAVKAAGRSS